MINFNGDSVWNLKPIDVSSVKTQVFGLLIEGEEENPELRLRTEDPEEETADDGAAL